MKQIVLLLFGLSFFCATAQHQDKVDFLRAEAFIQPVVLQEQINGSVRYEFKVLEAVDSIFLDAKNMDFESVLLNQKSIKFYNDKKTISIRSDFEAGTIHFLTLRYTTQPKQTVYFVGFDDDVKANEQIWTQGQGKYTSHWLPSFDDMEEKVEFDLSFDDPLDTNIIIANGMSQGTKSNHAGGFHSFFDMKKPMSSYLLSFAIGNYQSEEVISASGIEISNYYYPQDSARVEPTYRYTKEIFDFLEKEIGVPYPWQNYKQIPVRDFLYAGMENTTATIFADGYVIDSTAFIDKNYVNVNAHELAHQWFGNLVTEKDGNHHWLHEGFATYYAQLAEKELFGGDHYYWKLYTSLLQLQDGITRGEGQALTDPKASSLIFYEKGAWALFMLRNHIGDKAFKTGIRRYLEKYQFKNVTITDFLNEMEMASSQDLTSFRKDWLANTELPFDLAKKQLRKEAGSLDELFVMEEALQKASKTDFDFMTYWDKTNSIHLKKHLLDNHYSALDENLLRKAFASDTLPIRQVLAQKMNSIPPAFKTNFESLLNDKSYVTVENALFKLWASYPAEKARHLEQTKHIIGLPDKNVRLLWLTLAILTNDYNGRNTKSYFKELSSYTGNQYGWDVRMGAFQYLNQALGLNTASLRNLVEATNHHSWQFKKFARNLVEELLKDPDYKLRFLELVNELNEEETRYLKSKL